MKEDVLIRRACVWAAQSAPLPCWVSAAEVPGRFLAFDLLPQLHPMPKNCISVIWSLEKNVPSKWKCEIFYPEMCYLHGITVKDGLRCHQFQLIVKSHGSASVRISYHNHSKNLRHWCYWCLLVLTGNPEKEGTRKKLIPANESKQREKTNSLCWFCSQASCREVYEMQRLKPLLVATGSWSHSPVPLLLPTRNKQTSKQEKLQYNTHDWDKEEEKEVCFAAFQFSVLFLLLPCLCTMLKTIAWLGLCARSKVSLGAGARAWPGWWQARTGLHLLCPSHGYPGRQSCWNQGRYKCCQKATNPKCWDGRQINDALKSKSPGFRAVLWEAGQKATLFERSKSGKDLEAQSRREGQEAGKEYECNTLMRFLCWFHPRAVGKKSSLLVSSQFLAFKTGQAL